jgi:hypothetical protein
MNKDRKGINSLSLRSLYTVFYLLTAEINIHIISSSFFIIGMTLNPSFKDRRARFFARQLLHGIYVGMGIHVLGTEGTCLLYLVIAENRIKLYLS